jgi:phosphoglycolate phosphatase-like HAD superfamily hydrolase
MKVDPFKGNDSLIFDLDNTLIDENNYLFAAYKEIGNHFGETLEKKEEMFQFLVSNFIANGRGNLFDKFSKYFFLTEEHINLMLTYLRKTRVNGGLDILVKAQNILLSVCESKKPFFIITNGNVEQQKNKVAQINWKDLCRPVQIVYANEFSPKPAIDSYIYLNSKFSFINPIYIGDSESDLIFARNVGIDFININHLITE